MNTYLQIAMVNEYQSKHNLTSYNQHFNRDFSYITIANYVTGS